MTTHRTPKDHSTPQRPVSVAALARALNVNRSTVWRALYNDPTAPFVAGRDDLDRPLYDLATVVAWWPTRRRRGRPTQPEGEQQTLPLPGDRD